MTQSPVNRVTARSRKVRDETCVCFALKWHLWPARSTLKFLCRQLNILTSLSTSWNEHFLIPVILFPYIFTAKVFRRLICSHCDQLSSNDKLELALQVNTQSRPSLQKTPPTRRVSVSCWPIRSRVIILSTFLPSFFQWNELILSKNENLLFSFWDHAPNWTYIV